MTTADGSVETYRALFGDTPFTVVSNREPYVPRVDDFGTVSWSHPAGGLTAALDPVMQAMGGTWIAWGSQPTGSPRGRAAASPLPTRLQAPPGADRNTYEVRRVRLTENEVRHYYHGYANESLWPLCHNLLEHVRFRDRFWKAYGDVNGKFAAAVLEQAPDERTLIWLHDYHLALAPELIRRRRPASLIAHFWHIPWPAWDTFRVCPNHRQLLEGLLANDLLAFHLESFVDNFIRCCEQDLDALVDPRKRAVIHRGHVTTLRALPISIDAESMRHLASSPDTDVRVTELRARFGLAGRRVGIGVDRLDYSKGILERIDALRILFTRHPELVGTFTFIQVGAPSRTEIPAYAELQRRVQAAVERLNRSFERPDWQPILYIPNGASPPELAAFYRIADVAIVSSLQDGMNLVAKEFVAAQVEGTGVLCLSEFAGAAEEFDQALIVNPFYVEGFAEDIRRALSMDPAEKRERMRRMQDRLEEGNVYRWIADFFEAAREALDLGHSRPHGEDPRSAPTPRVEVPPRAAAVPPRE
ncbi:MAG: trehalose-6-phosphate synthase [Gemmatimonadetes bacterium]|nr:trehalose-6-phosphate synthase [Gemmatimonadota bacterium]